MDLKTFFAVNEMAMHEMAGMPRDNPYNGFMYQQAMAKYGTKYEPGVRSPWPRGTKPDEKAQDAVEWHRKAAAEGIYPSKPPTPKTIISALEWPLAIGSGLKSPNAAQNMRALMVDVGFATQEQMDQLAKAEEMKGQGLEVPKMSQTVKTKPVDPKAPLPGRPPPEPSFDI